MPTHDAARPHRLVTLGRFTLLVPDGSEEPTLRTRPLKLALLAYLALAERPLSRDHLADVFWGERGDERARHSLREALSHLRRVLGADALVPRAESLQLAPGAVEIDVRALLAAHRSGEAADVVRHYGGPFLDGVHVASSPRFDEWSAMERDRCERAFVRACATECSRLRRSGALDDAIALAERWLAADPESATAAAALRDAVEAAPIVRLAPPQPTVPLQLTPEISVAKIAATEISGARRPAPPRTARRTLTLSAAVLGVLGALAIGSSLGRAPTVDAASVRPPTLLVAGIDPTPGEAAGTWPPDGLARLVGAGLTAERIVDVVDPDRVRDALLRGGASDRSLSTDDALDVARRLHATWLLSGAASRGEGRYLLDLSLRDAASGRVRLRVTVADSTLSTAIGRVAARLLPAVDDHGPGAPHLEGVETSDVGAYRAFVRAQRLAADGRRADMVAALDAAIAADSGFVAAIVQRREWLGFPGNAAARDSADRLMAAFARNRDRASPFDRLELDTFVALHDGDHALAESLARALVARFPRDPRSHVGLVTVLAAHGRFTEAVDEAMRARALDSAGRAIGGAPCESCPGFDMVAALAVLAGDLPRAEAAARGAVTREADRPGAWASLGSVLAARRRSDEALVATRHAAALAPLELGYAASVVLRLIEARRLDAADSALRPWLVAGDAARVREATVLRAMVLRERGRDADAARLLQRAARAHADDDVVAERLIAGSSLARLSDARGATRLIEAAALHGGIATPAMRPDFPRDAARAFAWPHALLADALYVAGSSDTLRLLALADSVEVVGARSYFARDWRLHHHVRALVAMRGQRWSDAERELEAARFGPAGWTRTVVELARAQLAQGKAPAAVATLRDAYAGPIDGMGAYVPRSEIDWWMARALSAAGERDSARVYAGFARAAWRNADAPARARLAVLDSLDLR